jgi:hypothetical protein
VSWITGIAAESISGSGNAILPYTVEENHTTSSRTGTLTVAGRTVTVTQSGSTYLEVRGAYTLEIKVSSSCRWDPVQVDPPGFGNAPPPPFVYPLTSYTWPVTVTVDTYLNGTTYGSVQDSQMTFRTSVYASPTSSSIGNGDASNDTNQNGRQYRMFIGWDNGGAGAPSRAGDGRGQILNGILGELRAVLWERSNNCSGGFCNTGHEWVCGAGNTWTLQAR